MKVVRYEFFIHIIFLMSLWHSQIMHNFFVFKSRSLGDTLAHQSEVYRETARVMQYPVDWECNCSNSATARSFYSVLLKLRPEYETANKKAPPTAPSIALCH